MSTSVQPLAQILADNDVTLPERALSHVDGAPLPVDRNGNTVPVFYPATEELVVEIQEADAQEVDIAVTAARRAFAGGPWPHLPVSERQRLLRAAGSLIRQHQQELAVLESLCAGLTAAHLALRQIPRAAQNFEFFADVIGTLGGETFEQEAGFLTTVTREPAGVAALLAPWNAPLALASMQIASCIAFGNCCVLKPSEYTPLSILRMVQLLEQAGIPAGVVNVVNGKGPVTGEALVAHRDIDRIAFTGGTETARHIMRGAAQNLTPVHFELGGKSANIVFADADLERALDGSLLNVYANNGQICIAGSRILVQRAVAETFFERFAARVKRMRIGDPMSPYTEIGPLAFRAHRDRVLAYAQLAREEGAQILTGGNVPPGFDRGWYIEPTAVRVDSNALRICQEEIFGPFATLQVFDEPEEAIAIANDSRFGLVAYGWTENLGLALKLQRELRAGTVWINTPLLRDLRAPFGGFGDSGIGRDGPRQCAEFYTEEKAGIFARGKAPIRKLGAS
jgi:acyl-CoA reductase-like NAD-dependent aldehyde dehydrogenase